MSFLKKQSNNNLTSEELLEIKSILQDRINQVKILKDRECNALDEEYRKHKREILNKYILADRIFAMMNRIDVILQEIDIEGSRFKLNLEQPKTEEEIMMAVEEFANEKPVVNNQRIA